MKIEPFKLERYFAQYEFSAKYLLSSSDCDGLEMKDILAHTDDEMKNAWEQLTLGYTESQGSPMLRNEIAKLYATISEENILVVVPEEGIFLTISNLLEKGDHVIATFPGYQSFYSVAEAMGVEVTHWMPQEEKGWRFDPTELPQLLKENTKLLVINFPHNPTGCMPTKEEYETIIAFAREHNLYVLSDEMYRLLEFTKESALPSACDEYEKAISLFGMSKTFGLAGLRIGWLVTKDKQLLHRIADMKDYTTICSSAPSELLSVMALRDKDRIVAMHLDRIKGNLELLDGFFNRHNQTFSWSKPNAGTIGFAKLDLPMGSMAFAQQLVKDTGIMVLPSSVYDYDDTHFRLGFGRKNMPEVLQLFEKYVTEKNY